MFDDDFPDAFDMAFMLGLSEEMAEEKQALREMQDDDREDALSTEDDRDDGWRYRNRPGSNPWRKRSCVRKCRFTQYTRDVTHRFKSPEDPAEILDDGILWDTLRFDHQGVSGLRVWNTELVNSHLVSDHFVRYVGMVLGRFWANDVRHIVFSIGNNISHYTKARFSEYIPASRTIHIRLLPHLDHAFSIAATGGNGFSIRALTWHAMILSLLRELHRNLYPGDADPDDVPDPEEMAGPDTWAWVVGPSLSEEIFVEPPPAAKDPVLGPILDRRLHQRRKPGASEWLARQKGMHENGLVYYHKAGETTIDRMFKAYWASQENPMGKVSPELRDSICRDLDAAPNGQQRDDDMAELLLEMAGAGRAVEIHLNTLGEEENDLLQILPREIEYRKGYHFLRGILFPGGEETRIRMDRIEKLGGS